MFDENILKFLVTSNNINNILEVGNFWFKPTTKESHNLYTTREKYWSIDIKFKYRH